MPTSAWPPGPAKPRLHPDQVHVWRCRLFASDKAQSSLLSPDEAARAARFHFPRDRERYISSRVTLRSILGRYLDCQPWEIEFTLGAHGKPALANEDPLLQFNLSHSEDLMLLAVAQGRQVGIDVESTDRVVSFEALAERYFPPEDARALRTAPSSERSWKFYEIWTSIEARLKALGTGLGGDWSADRERWSMHQFRPAERFAAALAVEGANFHLEQWSWLS